MIQLRRGAVVVLVACLALTVAPLASANQWDAIRSWKTARESRVVDGDTLIVLGEVTGAKACIRFIGINAPGLSSCGGQQAKSVLEQRATEGARVPPQRTVLAWNDLTGASDRDFAWGMAQRGWGTWLTVPREAAPCTLFRGAVTAAQQLHDGIWNPSLCGPPTGPEVQLRAHLARRRS